jgi:hypothetical protein
VLCVLPKRVGARNGAQKEASKKIKVAVTKAVPKPTRRRFESSINNEEEVNARYPFARIRSQPAFH